MPLELTCQVSQTADSDNFTIQWHYSSSSSPPSLDNNTSTDTILESKVHTVEIKNDTVTQNRIISRTSVLKLTNYTEMASGYYWCTVNPISFNQTLNPSQVINVTICPFTGDKAGNVGEKCKMQVNLCETPMPDRCADHPASINITNVHFQGMCMNDDNKKSTTVTTLDITETIHASEPLATTHGHTSKESTTTDTEGTYPNLDLSLSNQFPMYYVWMIVGIAFGILVAIIIIMLIAIVYLNHKKNKIRGKTIRIINRYCMTLQLILANACVQASKQHSTWSEV